MVSVSSDVLRVLERQIEEATQLRVALARGTFGTLKHDLLQMLADKPLFRDLATPRWFRNDHTSTAALLEVIGTCKKRVNAIAASDASSLVTEVRALRSRGTRLKTLFGQRAHIKQRIVNLIEAAQTPSALKDAVRANLTFGEAARVRTGIREAHFDSVKMAGALRAVASTLASTPAHVDFKDTLEAMADQLIPGSAKGDLKKDIVAFFAAHEELGHLGSQRWIRKTHAPLDSLIAALEDAELALEELASATRRQALSDELDHKALLLGQRVKMKERLARVDEAVAASSSALDASRTHVRKFADELAKKRRTLDSALRQLEEKSRTLTGVVDDLTSTVSRLQDELTAALDALDPQNDGAAPAAPSASADVVRIDALLVTQRTLLQTRTAELAQVDAQLAEAEARRDELVQVQLHCREQQQALEQYLTRAERALDLYREAEVLVFYFRVNDDIYATLQAVGRFLRAGRDGPDALGRVHMVFAIEVGVRAGVDLGILNLGADVRLTLMLSGGLAVLDSREFMFTSRVSLFVSAGVSMRLGTPESASDLAQELSDGLIEPPEVLLEASARVGCSLLDRESCEVFESDEHWATMWAHGIAKRIAFLRRYKITEAIPREGGEEWLDAAMRVLGTSGVAVDDAASGTGSSATPSITSGTASAVTPTPSVASSSPATTVAPSQVRAALDDGTVVELTDYRKLITDAAQHLARWKARPVRELTLSQHSRLEAEARIEAVALGTKGVARSPGRASFTVTSKVAGSATQAAPLCVLHEDTVAWKDAVDTKLHGALIFHRIEAGAGEREYLELEVKRVTSASMLEWTSAPAHPVVDVDERLKTARLLSALARSGTTEVPLPLPALLGESRPSARDAHDLLARRLRGQMKAMLDERAARGNALYARYALRWRYVVGDGGVLRWEQTWAPQIYRVMTNQQFKFLKRGEIPVIPGVSVHLGVELRFRRDSSIYELLGTDTFGYLKIVYPWLKRGGTAWDAYWREHWLEIKDILDGVAHPDTGPFGELAHDVLRSDAPAALKRAAAELGKVCWEHFAPGEDSPFVSATQSAWSATIARAREEKQRRGRLALTTLDRARLEEGWARIDTPALHETLARMVMASNQTVDIEGRASARVTRADAAIRLSQSGVAKTLSTLTTAWTTARRKVHATLALKPSGMTQPEVVAAARALMDGIDALAAPLIELDVHLGASHGSWRKLTREGVRSATDDEQRVQLLRPALEATIAGLQLTSLIPDNETWKRLSKDNVSIFTIRSKETLQLDADVNQYHQDVARLDRAELTHLRAAQATLKVGATPDETSRMTGLVLKAIEGRQRVLAELKKAVATWKGDREESKSARLAAVRMHLERPVIAQGMRLDGLRALLEVRALLGHLAREHGFLSDALSAMPRGTRSRVAQSVLTMARLKKALEAYLGAANDELRDDVVLHGIKKLALPGAREPDEEVKPTAPSRRRDDGAMIRTGLATDTEKALWSELRSARKPSSSSAWSTTSASTPASPARTTGPSGS